VAAYAAAAAAQPQSSADDVVAQVLSCAATNNTETGVLAQVGGGTGVLLTIDNPLLHLVLEHPYTLAMYGYFKLWPKARML